MRDYFVLAGGHRRTFFHGPSVTATVPAVERAARGGIEYKEREQAQAYIKLGHPWSPSPNHRAVFIAPSHISHPSTMNIGHQCHGSYDNTNKNNTHSARTPRPRSPTTHSTPQHTAPSCPVPSRLHVRANVRASLVKLCRRVVSKSKVSLVSNGRTLNSTTHNHTVRRSAGECVWHNCRRHLNLATATVSFVSLCGDTTVTRRRRRHGGGGGGGGMIP